MTRRDSRDSFGAEGTLEVGDRRYRIHRLSALEQVADLGRVPYSIKLLLENLLRHEDGASVKAETWRPWPVMRPAAGAAREIAYSPARILLQDFTGVPCVVDLAAMRDAIEALGGSAGRINPLVPVDLVIDHSVVVDAYARRDALKVNTTLEYERNAERYRFLRWGQQAFSNLRVVPPGTGICHQVNLEYLSSVVFTDAEGAAYPDTVVGTDSHTPMVNGLGVLAWGVGGIEAEAAMLGQPISMLVPPVVGLRLTGELPEATTATDLVLTVAELLRAHGVVGKFVECYGPGVAKVPLENRATIGNMSPEYGSTVTIFRSTLRLSAICGSPAGLRRAAHSWRPTPRNRGCGTTRQPNPPIANGSSSTSRPSSRASPARRARRTGFRSAGPRRCSPKPSALASRSRCNCFGSRWAPRLRPGTRAPR